MRCPNFRKSLYDNVVMIDGVGSSGEDDQFDHILRIDFTPE